MLRSLFTTLVLGALCLPLVFAAVPAFVGTQIAERYIRERDALPAFDRRLCPGEQEIATTPVHFRERGRIDTSYGLATIWPETVERLLVDHIGALWRANSDLPILGEPGTGDD